MPLALQTYLSPRPSTRTRFGDSATCVGHGGATLYTFCTTPTGEAYQITKVTIDHPAAFVGGIGPPIHVHPKQDETFEILQGVIAVHLDGVDIVLDADSPDPGGKSIVVHRGKRHTFFVHALSKERNVDIEYKVAVTPELSDGFDEKFIRNFMGYMADCSKTGLKPSTFQVILFLYAHDVLLSPYAGVPVIVVQAAHFVVAVVFAEWLLGYEREYPEYYTAPKAL